jgi:hypothetical protein
MLDIYITIESSLHTPLQVEGLVVSIGMIVGGSGGPGALNGSCRSRLRQRTSATGGDWRIVEAHGAGKSRRKTYD